MNRAKRNITITVVVAIVAITGIAALTLSIGSKDKKENIVSKPPASQAANLVDTESTEYKSYITYVGEDYDRYFIANMIAHHQGAVDMANLALKNSQRQEILDMASAIITAQTNEINDMTSWQTAWNYPASSGEAMIDHSAMGMDAANADMMNELNGKTGAAFDKAFLAQMIVHHQSAINMSAPGKTNAQHQEIKDLTVAIIAAQTKEIQQMKQWQKDWGY